MMRFVALLGLLLVGACAGHPIRASAISPPAAVHEEPVALDVGCPKRPCVATLTVLGEIDDDSAMALGQKMTAWAALKPAAYVVLINSGGGDTDAARGIHNGLRALGRPVRCLVLGNAQSAAFLVLQACTARYAIPTSILMIHEASISLPAKAYTAKELRTFLGDIEATTDVMAAAVGARMKLPAQDVRARFAQGDWSMSPLAAERAGALDGVWEGSVARFVELARTAP